MEKATLTVKGMSCDHCVRAIKDNIGKLDGVKQVEVHLQEGKVDVAFDSQRVSLGKITETIEDQGYDVA
ncbi:copper chaperone CopZ [Desmospora profundinema]|uniref:Copper chaperone CopZ n=1 Tax=Desmospora profundinema TaxID=1571184 RepID=A0ABU1IJ97_9BACL|nr:copper chaperone CopZ [Desmospora profundinema]MDR6224833.1 copper chaperone [Desmospora profundinema]